MSDPVPLILAEVAAERDRQDAKFGEQNHPDGTSPGAPVLSLTITEAAAYTARRTCQDHARRGRVTWLDIALEEVFEALAEDDPAKLRAELIQCAAVFAAWVQAIDRRSAKAGAV